MSFEKKSAVEQKIFGRDHSESYESLKCRIDSMIENIGAAYSSDGLVFDLSPDSLQLMTRTNLYDRSVQIGSPVKKTMAWIGEGAVLGEVIVRNLGGKWSYPSYARIAVYQALMWLGVSFSKSSRIMLPKIQVELNGKMIPVMTIGRLRVKWDERVFSLSKAFEEIRTTGEWSGKVPLTPLERRILREKRLMGRIWRWSWLYDPRDHNSRTINQFIRRIMFDRELIRIGETAGGDDYSPDGLKLIDNFFSKKNLEERMKPLEAEKLIYSELGKKNFRLMSYRGVGGYLGEVIVRCLGGEWVFPTNKDFLNGLKKHQDITYLHDRCFVKLGDNLIPIMTIAQLRLEDKISSITAVYEEIKLTGKWSEKKP